jgi:hypothetical protein
LAIEVGRVPEPLRVDPVAPDLDSERQPSDTNVTTDNLTSPSNQTAEAPRQSVIRAAMR